MFTFLRARHHPCNRRRDRLLVSSARLYDVLRCFEEGGKVRTRTSQRVKSWGRFVLPYGVLLKLAWTFLESAANSCVHRLTHFLIFINKLVDFYQLLAAWTSPDARCP